MMHGLMNAPSPVDVVDDGRLLLAREAFRRFRGQCFWFMRPDLEITAAYLPMIVRGLRLHGGRVGFALADRICR